MPNLTIEYTSNLPAFDTRRLLAACNRAMAESGHFQESDIKSRALCVEDFVIGTSAEPRAFVHASFALLSGRSADIKRDLAQRLLSILEERFPPVPGLEIQLLVELRDMERESFQKRYLKA